MCTQHVACTTMTKPRSVNAASDNYVYTQTNTHTYNMHTHRTIVSLLAGVFPHASVAFSHSLGDLWVYFLFTHFQHVSHVICGRYTELPFGELNLT